MSIITLTTDFGIKDHFVGAVKGALYLALPNTKIVDISHNISPFNIVETAYILKNAYKNFPNNTIHIVGVDTELSEENKHLALKLNNQYFICPDNGLISMIASETKIKKIVQITIYNEVKTSFPVLNVFVKVAAHIAKGGSLNELGKEIYNYKKLVEIKPKVNEEQTVIKGGVIYIDNYGNIITNIKKKLFTSIGKGRSFSIKAGKYSFEKVFNCYNEIVNYSLPKEKRQYDGEKLAVFNSEGYLEIAIYRSNKETLGSASTLLGLKYQDTVRVEFKSNNSADFKDINSKLYL
ncbi:MAG: S-adenosyl-l-methionine hydroxide adenosyltransferase family protein [Tenacibaculum sp.]